MTEVLVTGAHGLIGTALTRMLVLNGYAVRRLDYRVPRGHRQYGDIRDQELIGGVAGKVDGIVHLAAVSRVQWACADPDRCWQINVAGTSNIIQAAARSKRRPFVIVASSREIYGEPAELPVQEDSAFAPINVYGRSKVACERAALAGREASVNVAVVRFSNVYGSIADHGDRVVPAFARAASEGRPMHVCGRAHVFDFTHVDDTARGTLALLEAILGGERQPPPIHFVTGRATTLEALAEMANRAAGGRSEILEAPTRSNDVARFVGDPTRAEQLLGWRAAIAVEDGVRQLVDDFARPELNPIDVDRQRQPRFDDHEDAQCEAPRVGFAAASAGILRARYQAPRVDLATREWMLHDETAPARPAREGFVRETKERSKSIPDAILSGGLQLADLVLIAGAGLAAFHWRWGSLSLPDIYSFALVMALLLALHVLRGCHLYDMRDLAAGVIRWRKLLLACSALFASLMVITFVTKTSTLVSREWFVVWFVLSLTAMGLIRLAYRELVVSWREAGRLDDHLVIVGAGEQGQSLLRELTALQQPGFRIVGLFDDRAKRVPRKVGNQKVLGNLNDLLQFARSIQVDQVIIALPWGASARAVELAEKLGVLPVDILVYPDSALSHFSHCEIEPIGHATMLRILRRPLTHSARLIKTIEDYAVASIALILSIPLMALIAVAIVLESKGPVLFIQQRYGFNNNIIRVYKFRSMYHHCADPDAQTLTSPDDPRVTSVGSFLRRTSLDELPQLFNVLKGEMSIVGPRPHPIAAKAAGHYYSEIIANYVSRHRVKPGITGWAQVNGYRGETATIEAIKKRVDHDLEYIRGWSLWLDFVIMAKTLQAVWSGQNAY